MSRSRAPPRTRLSPEAPSPTAPPLPTGGHSDHAHSLAPRGRRVCGSTTYTPAPRGRRVRGDVCYLHSGPEREACAWHHILLTPRPRRGGACAVLYATYTPAPRGRCVRGAIRYLHSGPDRPRGRRVCRLNAAYTPAPNGRRVCGTATPSPPPNRGGRPHAANGPRAAVGHGSALRGAA